MIFNFGKRNETKFKANLWSVTVVVQPEFQILIGIYCTYDLYDEGLNQFFKHFQGTSSSSSKQPPYSPRSSLLSPVKFGDQLQPQLKAVQPPSGSSYTSYRLPSYSRDNLIEKLRQVRISESATYLLRKIINRY